MWSLRTADSLKPLPGLRTVERYQFLVNIGKALIVTCMYDFSLRLSENECISLYYNRRIGELKHRLINLKHRLRTTFQQIDDMSNINTYGMWSIRTVNLHNNIESCLDKGTSWDS